MDGDSWRTLFRDLVNWYCDYWIHCDVCLTTGRYLSLADCPIKEFLDRAADLEDAEKRRG